MSVLVVWFRWLGDYGDSHKYDQFLHHRKTPRSEYCSIHFFHPTYFEVDRAFVGNLSYPLIFCPQTQICVLPAVHVVEGTADFVLSLLGVDNIISLLFDLSGDFPV